MRTLKVNRLIFETDDDLSAAIMELRSMGQHARKLLSECVEHQCITRTTVFLAEKTTILLLYLLPWDHC